MAASIAKRPLPAKVEAMKARKRRKMDSAEAKQESKSKSKPGSAKKVRTVLNALAWKSVDTPDGLDDYEGFFGLEEVEDVDVVKDEETGVVRFEARPSESEANGGARISGVDVGDKKVWEDEEEWNGFGDDENQAPADINRPTQKSAKEQRNSSTKQNGISQFAYIHVVFLNVAQLGRCRLVLGVLDSWTLGFLSGSVYPSSGWPRRQSRPPANAVDAQHHPGTHGSVIAACQIRIANARLSSLALLH